MMTSKYRLPITANMFWGSFLLSRLIPKTDDPMTSIVKDIDALVIEQKNNNRAAHEYGIAIISTSNTGCLTDWIMC